MADETSNQARFDDARLLADHAGRHVARVKEMAERERGSLANLRSVPSRLGYMRYSVDVIRVIPPEISLYGADALHNMRSAMELAVWAAASFVPDAYAKRTKIKFPHGGTRLQYVKELQKLDGLLPGTAILFLETVDLYRSDVPLYPLFEINNSNKHRELIPLAFDIPAIALERRGQPQQFISVPKGLGTKLGSIDLGEVEGPAAEGMTWLYGIRFVNGGKLGPTTMIHMVKQTRDIVDGLAFACEGLNPSISLHSASQT